MSSDGGRNFLSTRVPVRTENRRPAAQPGVTEIDEKKDHAVKLTDFLQQFFPGRRGE